MAGHAWKGLFEWTMRHSDGTQVSELAHTEIDPAKMAWLQEVLANYVQDLTTRLQEIKAALEEPENHDTSLQQQEALLDELKDIVEDLDQAKDLHLIGGLPVLMELLESPEGSLRWRAAEIVATCVQNNHPVQQAFFEAGVLPKVLALVQDGSAQCQLKGWMAVSCLIRNFQPAHEAFLQANGFQSLLSSLESSDARLQRRLLLLLEYLISQPPIQSLKGGPLGRVIALMESDDMDVRERSMGVLTAVAQSSQGRQTLHANSFLEALNKMETSLRNFSAEEEDSRSAERHLYEELKTVLKDGAVIQDQAGSAPQESNSSVLLLKER